MRAMATRVPWSHDELLCALRLYCRTPFGKLHQHNPDIIELATMLGRTPSAVGMKTCNFASLDPTHQSRNVAGLGNVSRADRDLFAAFDADSEAIAAEAEEVYARYAGKPDLPTELTAPDGPTEVSRTVRTRRVQSFFRAAVMASYENTCALSGIALGQLLNASHIIPWSVEPSRRADPRNGIALNALYDRAFDRGLITFDENLCVVVSDQLRADDPPLLQRQALLDIDGAPLREPHRFAPDADALAFHRECVFQVA
jgi:HNH endonuclease